MMPILRALLAFAVSLVRSRVSLQMEIVILRHQLAIYQRSLRRPRVRPTDRILWAWLARKWTRWQEFPFFVQPATVLAWQQRRFRDHWARLSQYRGGRPGLAKRSGS
jgi:putative transposase